ncbi:alpha/beta fold hydrolase [Massilia soli]|uniref:Alpha/beta fold hydrolase n=1 Tax=Massilia soli TaxID=2792854 RepID=A0ABS7STB1_9BURK|nr:alpha/beta fold hydrolase [Massilia soli]MBZ2209198.1 alpha/beta fold hydrolase [Massilia soli]
MFKLASSLLMLAIGALAHAEPVISPATSAPAPVIFADLPYLPGTTFAALSPNGQYIAMIRYEDGDSTVMVADVADLKFKPVAKNKKGRDGFWTFSKVPLAVHWIGNDLLAINYNKGADAITRDGKFVANLGDRVIRSLPGSDPAAPMVMAYADLDDMSLVRVNARNGRKDHLSFPMSGKPIAYAFDARGEPRAVTMIDSSFWKDATTITNWFKPPGKQDWQKLEESRVVDDFWIPLHVPAQENTIVISSRRGRDTYAIFEYNTQTKSIGEMMAGHPSLDIVRAVGMDKSTFELVSTSGMRQTQVWFNPEWAALQKAIDKLFPKHHNVLNGDLKSNVLVHSRSDVDPGAWYVLNVAAMSLRHVGSYHSTIHPESMRPMASMSYPVSDGFVVPAFLTLPDVKTRPLPTVVMIHGGPTERDEWGFNPEVQMLAAKGYAVFQPQFRGSTGFGRKYEEAGYGQWGLGMQDDVTAGVEYLIKKGIADPKRICIYGASYGGYAAMWGLAKTPELYRCGISFAGVADLELMFRDSSNRNSNKAAAAVLRHRIGDPKLNKQQFDQVSPLKHAGRIVAPVLLMHGDEDQIVPIIHGEKLRDALIVNGKRVEWRKFEGEGHGTSTRANLHTYYNAMTAFLAKHIGPGETTPTPAAAPKTPP